jgi:hypothetical protein
MLQKWKQACVCHSVCAQIYFHNEEVRYTKIFAQHNISLNKDIEGSDVLGCVIV